MAKVTAQLEGMDLVREALRRVPDQTRVLMADVIAKSTFSVAVMVISGAPMDTGLLKRSITARSRGMVGRVEAGVDAHYWPHLEFGTVRAAARPFIRPAVEREAPVFEQRIRAAAKRLEREFATSGRTI